VQDAIHFDLDLINDYQEKYVAFIDLLGFSQLIAKVGADVMERHRVIEALKIVKDTFCHNPAIDMRFTYFSDCIVLSAKRSPHALWQIFQSIELLTLNLLQHDFFTRGALVVGPTHHSEHFVFGTTVVEAYNMEKHCAHQPLVLLSPEVVKDTEAQGADFTQWIKKDGRDKDGRDRHFLHYLMRYEIYKSERYPGEVILEYPAKLISHFVRARLNKDKGGILEKAQWFQTYWNETVAVRGVLPPIGTEMPSAEIELPHPTIIVKRLIAPVKTAHEKRRE
jgi:hypothetical protein